MRWTLETEKKGRALEKLGRSSILKGLGVECSLYRGDRTQRGFEDTRSPVDCQRRSLVWYAFWRKTVRGFSDFLGQVSYLALGLNRIFFGKSRRLL